MADRPLAHCRILVTRPQGQALPLIDAIQQQGGQAWHFPLLAITELTDDTQRQACKQRFMELDQYQHVIFISTNAVHFGVAWIEDYWPQLPIGINWHGIGNATCHAMTDAGLPVTTEFTGDHPMNSEALLEDPLLQSPTQQKILIVRGIGGREHLQNELVARGAQVDVAECYQRHAPSAEPDELLQLINAQHIGTICINSGDSLLNLCELVGKHIMELQPLRLVVPSRRVAELAAARGFQHVVTASNASDNAVLAALIEAETNNH